MAENDSFQAVLEDWLAAAKTAQAIPSVGRKGDVVSLRYDGKSLSPEGLTVDTVAAFAKAEHDAGRLTGKDWGRVRWSLLTCKCTPTLLGVDKAPLSATDAWVPPSHDDTAAEGAEGAKPARKSRKHAEPTLAEERATLAARIAEIEAGYAALPAYRLQLAELDAKIAAAEDNELTALIAAEEKAAAEVAALAAKKAALLAKRNAMTTVTHDAASVPVANPEGQPVAGQTL